MFDRIASAVRSDCVRRPIRLRPPSDQIAFAIYSYNHRMYTQLAPSRIVIRIVACWRVCQNSINAG